MTELSTVGEKTQPISDEVRSFIDAKIRVLQQARLDTRHNTTLEDIFRGRNPYYLRSTRHAAWQLVQCCLEYYLLTVDEVLFADFARELSDFAARRGQQLPQSGAMLELLPLDDLPLRFEVEEESVRLYNRLTYRLYEELSDAEPLIDWERLTRFISECAP